MQKEHVAHEVMLHHCVPRELLPAEMVIWTAGYEHIHQGIQKRLRATSADA